MSILKYLVRLSFFGSHSSDYFLIYNNTVTVEGLAEPLSTNGAAPYFNQNLNYIPIFENERLDHDTGFSGAS